MYNGEAWKYSYCTLWGSGLRVAVGESLAQGLYAFGWLGTPAKICTETDWARLLVGKDNPTMLLQMETGAYLTGNPNNLHFDAVHLLSQG